jgi:release factor glutamine methyltransferase
MLMPEKTKKDNNKIDQLDRELLLSLVLQKSREYVISHPEINLSLFQKIKLKSFIKKRKRGVPLAYITGHKEFFGLDFLVNKHTLIPRPDTELMVELAIEKINKPTPIDNRQLVLVDVGTGSGCIPIAILKNLNTEKIKNLRVHATDISKSALNVAKKNAERHQIDIQFLHGNLLTPLIKNYPTSPISYQYIITANLPYLTQAQFDAEPSIQHEPHSALVADNDGLYLYEKLFQQIKQLAITYKLSAIICLFEIDPSQSSPMSTLIQTYFPGSSIEIKKDLAGQDRVVVLNLD